MGLDAIAKHYYPLLLCLLLGVVAYFQASAINQLILTAALPAPDPQAHAPSPAPRTPGRTDPRDLRADAILERNPFDSVTGPLTAVEASPPRPGAPQLNADPYDDPPCEMARATLITASDDPAWSFAVLTGPDGKSVLRRRGEDFYGALVNYIGDLRVWLTGKNGLRCQIKLGVKPPPMGPQPPDPSKTGGLPSAYAGRIRPLSAHEFDVDRSVIDSLIANPAEMMKVRVVPDKDGIKLFGIRPNTLLGAIGVENGDRLISVNGFEMNDPQKMLEAYGKLMRADRLSASVIRNGKPMTLDFNIR